MGLFRFLTWKLFIGTFLYARGSEVHCCFKTCVIVKEEKCDPILSLVSEKLRLSVVESYATPGVAPTLNTTSESSLLRQEISGILEKLRGISSELTATLTGAARGPGLSASDSSALLAKVDDMNDEYESIASILGLSTTKDATTSVSMTTLGATTNYPTTDGRTAELQAAGWVKNDENNLWYKVFDTMVTYNEAHSACTALGARLAIEMRHQTIRSFIEDYLNGAIGARRVNVWFGLTQTGTNWIWADGSALQTAESHWDNLVVAEPSGDGQCAEMRADRRSWNWNDVPCNVAIFYLCEL